MNKRKKALLLASITSLAILCGCGQSDSKKIITIDGEDYIQNGEEYTKIDISSKIFEPGEHRIAYVIENNNGYNFHNGWESIYTGVEVPEGYILEGVVTASENSGYTNVIIYTFVNTKRVEAQGNYNSYANVVEYITPGTVIEEKVLGMGD